MSKSKILISLVIMVLAVLLIGNVIALATETTQITAATGNTTSSNNTATNNTVTQIGATNISSNNNATANTNTNNAITTSNIVGAANTNTNNTNTNTNRNTNTSNYSTTNSSKLPYAGTSGTSIVILAIAFAASAIYAYKKVTDYNV